jgi:hypothetical protein
MTGYTRNDTANNIADGNVINASDLDGEFDALQAAFNGSTGHAHTGATGDSPKIDTTGLADDAVTAAILDDTGDFTVNSLTTTAGVTVNGNTTLGNADTDTVTITADIASNLIPSAETFNIGAVGSEWNDLYITGTANIDSLVADTADIDAGSIDGVTIGTNSAVTDLRVDNLKVDGNTISSTDTAGNIVLAPDTTGDVQLDADTIRVGDANADVTITTNGTGDLTLNTNAGTNSGVITIADAANGNIALTPNGTGEVDISKVDIDGGAIDGTIIGANSAAAATVTDLTASGTVTLGATDLTSTAAELNILDGATLDVNELNILDGVTATATELNYLDITTLGTSEASKAITADANNDTVVSGSVRGTVTTDNDLSFDMNATNNFKCTPSGTGALTFTNITSGQSGNILLINSGGHSITAAATTKINSTDLTTISTAGTYFISYYSDGTNVYVSTSANTVG